jgi:sugar lactone lactonase YvrE
VDITRDGHYAIFGDASTTYMEVEVSDISSGKLTPTIKYGGAGGGLGGTKGANSNNVWLSPDESLLYISPNWSGEVAAALFDKNTGTLSKGCFSGKLNGYQTKWGSTASLATKGCWL